MNNNNLTVTIDIEPKQNFHFRYATELNNTHGSLSGQQENINQQNNVIYPKIKLCLPENDHLDSYGNKRDFFVLCSLHCADNNALSPHLLMPLGEKIINYRFLFDQMEEVVGNPLERIWELRDYVIVRLVQKQYLASLKSKMGEYKNLLLPMEFQNILGQTNLANTNSVQQSGKTNVRLGFTIFERDFYNNTYKLCKETFFSCNIFHGDDLNIHRCCNTKGSIRGGKDVTILIKFESNISPLNVRIKKIKEQTNETEWSTIVENLERFGNHAITFKLPAYEGPKYQTDEIEVFIEICVANTKYKSNSVKFYYLNEETEDMMVDDEEEEEDLVHSLIFDSGFEIAYKSVSRDRVLVLPAKDKINLEKFNKKSAKSSLDIDRNLLIKEKIDKIFKMSEAGKLVIKDVYRIFFEALKSIDTLIHLYKKSTATKSNQRLVRNVLNKNGQNLLHSACKMNYFKCIRPLFGMGCIISKQDNWGRTPLHIALLAQNYECIIEIQKVIEKLTDYPEVEENFIEMLKIYDHNGHTVLHEALLGKHMDLLEIMLEFCQKHNINILDYETLGDGNSLAHLTVENNLIEMLPLIRKYLPNYLSIQNYGKKTILDLSNISDNMIKHLNII